MNRCHFLQVHLKTIIYHQPVVHAYFAETASNRVDVLLIDPGLEQLDSKCCRYS